MAASCSSVNAKRPRRASLQSQIKTDAQAVSCARGAQLSRLSDAWSPRWRARGEKERQFHAGGRTKETTYASRCINELARLLHVTTKAPMRRTRQRHALF